MDSRIKQLFGFVQERYLWQFFSRDWDRQANIDGILGMAEQLFAGQTPGSDTAEARCYLADAKVLVADFKRLFPWINEAGSDEIRQLLAGLKAELIDTTITQSKNRELRDHLY